MLTPAASLRVPHLLVALLLGSFQLHAEPPKPAILIDAWGGNMDLVYMRQLEQKGFVVDAVPHQELTWERLKQFNALLLVDFPQEGKVEKSPGHGPASGPNLKETLALLDKFLKSGGGVMFSLLQHANDPAFYNTASKALARWGASRPLETVTVPAGNLTEHPRLRIPFFFTDKVAPGPVSEGVKGIWYPLGGPWTYFTGPIEVDAEWTVVLQGPAGSQSTPIDLGQAKPGVPFYENPFQRPGGVVEPPLFAIRDLRPGRLALLHCSPIFHFSSGSSWMHDRAVLDKGLANRPSDFGRLLENTLRWLAELSLGQGELGGAVVPPDRWIPPYERPGAKETFDGGAYIGAYGGPDSLDPAKPPPSVKLHRGFVGPRTAFSGGQGNVADYAATARKLGLSFIIFLEDFSQLSRESLAALTTDCKAQSGDDLLLLAGYRVKTNLGNSIFFCGHDPLYVHDKHLSGPDKKTYQQQDVDKDGKFGPSRSIDFIFESLRNDVNTVGYFGFTGPRKQGGMNVEHLRLFSMAGILFYDHGKLVEDVTDQYLLTNQGTLTGTPVCVSLVDSPEEMWKEVEIGRGITHAAAPSVKNLWDGALRWNHQYFSLNVFPTTGPLIHFWPATYRTSSFAGESFVAWRMLLAQHLHVTADAGLKEVALYDGTKLYRRFLLGGAKEFVVRLFLNGSLQMNISIVATDQNGGKAVSFPYRGWNDASPAPVFCGDHVNDCGGMKLFRGPGWSRHCQVPPIANPGETWDGGPPASLPLFSIGQIFPAIISKQSRQDANIYPVPMLDFCDEHAYQGRLVARDITMPGVVHINAWSGYGPIEPAPLADLVGEYIEWRRYYTAAATAWGAHGIAAGIAPGLYTQLTTFKRDQHLQQLALSGLWRYPLSANVLLLTGEGDRLLSARDISPLKGIPYREYAIPTGGWFAGISAQPGNAYLAVNHGEPLRLKVWENRVELEADLGPKGRDVKAGEAHQVELFSLYWPMDIPIPDSETLLRWIRYFEQPDGLQLSRGKRLSTRLGILDLEAQEGAVELVVPRPSDGMNVTLPVRARGFNPRWSAILLQREGYNGGNRYGPPTNRVRSLGVSEDGRIYFPIYSGQAKTHVLAGHPIVADESGKDLFIQVTCLCDAVADKPMLWHVSVNNPTDAPVTTRFRRSMDLPGLAFEDTPLTLQPGEYKVLVHVK